MIQFTLGLILIVLSIFFGGKEVMANQKMAEGRERNLKTEESRVKKSNQLAEKFTANKEELIDFSANIKTNITNQLNIDQSRYNFNMVEPQQKQQAMLNYKFEIEGHNSFKNIYTLLSDIEKTKGLFVKNICFNCKVSNFSVPSSATDVSFKIEGDAYVFKNK